MPKPVILEKSPATPAKVAPVKPRKTTAKPAKKASKGKTPAKVEKSKATPAPLATLASVEIAIAHAKAMPRFSDYAPHWSILQKAIFDWIRGGTGSAIVEAVAGSGKTTTICEGAKYMQGSVCALAFNRSIAKELKDRFAPFPHITAGTVHKIGKDALVANLPHWIKIDGDKLKWIFKDNLQTETNWIAQGNVCKLCTMGKDAGAGIDFRAEDREAWQKLAEHFSIPAFQKSKTGAEEFDIIAMAIKLLALSNNDTKAIKNGKTMLRIDFSDMIYLPILWNIPMTKFDWVIVDEAQDLNLMRRLFIKAISKETTRHLIVGDTFQAVYGFTGADAKSMENMKETFSCVSFPLSICYRCSASVIEFAQTWMPYVEATPNAPLGSVTTLDYTKAMETPAEGFTCADVILCRNNAPIVKTAMQFIRANIPVKVEGNDLTAQLVNLANEFKGAGDLLAIRSEVTTASDERIAEAQAKERNGKASQIHDLSETLIVFIDRAIETHGTFEEMLRTITGFFAPNFDNGDKRDVLTLSTIHKAKGREWNRVFWLGREQFQPSKFAKLEWELGQEKNLCYVAATRAKLDLVELVNYPV